MMAIDSQPIADCERQAEAAIARLDAAARLHRVDGRDGNIVWRAFGGGPPLVLLHGGHGSWLHWVRNIEALSAGHTLLIPDMPGYGDSCALPAALDDQQRLAQIVDGLIASLDTLLGTGTRIDLAGFSFGGLVAALLAKERAGVRRLSLLGSAGHAGARRQTSEFIAWQGRPREAMRAALRHNLGAHMLHDGGAIDALAMAVHEYSCLHTRFHSRSLSRTSQLYAALAGFVQPVLLIWGEHDVTATPMTLAPELAQQCPAGEWCVVPGAGHWVQYERPHEVNSLLMSWFRQGSAR